MMSARPFRGGREARFERRDSSRAAWLVCPPAFGGGTEARYEIRDSSRAAGFACLSPLAARLSHLGARLTHLASRISNLASGSSPLESRLSNLESPGHTPCGRPQKQPHWFAPHLILRSLLELLVIGLFLVTFIAQPVRIPSRSMEPTLLPGDFVLADKQSFAPEGFLHRLLPDTSLRRGELAVFHFPPDPHRDLVKRIIGLPGDTIRLRDGHVLLNGQPLAEPYAFYAPGNAVPFRDEFPFLRTLDPDVEPAWWTTLRRSVHHDEITVPPGELFVLGDNRNGSEDSRYWGFVPADKLVGRPLLVYMPAPTQPATTLRQRLHQARQGIRLLH